MRVEVRDSPDLNDVTRHMPLILSSYLPTLVFRPIMKSEFGFLVNRCQVCRDIRSFWEGANTSTTTIDAEFPTSPHDMSRKTKPYLSSSVTALPASQF